MLDSNLRRLAFDDLIPLAAHRQRRIQDQRHAACTSPSKNRRSAARCSFRVGKATGSESRNRPTSAGVTRTSSKPRADAPVGEQANGVQIRLAREGIADLSVKELLERESSRSAGIPNERRQVRRIQAVRPLPAHCFGRSSSSIGKPSIRWLRHPSGCPLGCFTVLPTNPSDHREAARFAETPHGSFGNRRNSATREFFGHSIYSAG